MGDVMGLFKKTNLLLYVVALSIAVSCVGCSLQRNTTTQLATPDKEVAVSESKWDSKKVTSMHDVILDDGDKIEVKVFRNESLTTEVTLNRSGVISLPLVGDVDFRNKGVVQLRDEVQRRYSEYVVNPQVFINILELNSQKVFILGQVSTPGVINLNTEMTISEAIAKAGSVTKDANWHEILLVRRNANKFEVKKLDFFAIAQGIEPEQDLSLQNKDIIFVPEKWLSVTANYMSYISQILSPFVTLEGGIVLYPQVEDVFVGNGSSDIQTSIPVGGQ